MEFDTASLINVINEYIATDCPNVLAHMVVTKLNNEYEPDDRIFKIELIRQPSTFRMDVSDDHPNELFDKLSGIQRNFRSAKYILSEE